MKPLVKALALLLCLLATAVSQEITVEPEGHLNVGDHAWLRLPEEIKGKFEPGDGSFLLDLDLTHVAANTAFFKASTSGNYRIVAAYVDEAGEIVFITTTITVVGDGGPPPPPVANLEITEANVKAWASLVPKEQREAKITNPLTGEETTRQGAIATAFISAGSAATTIKSIPGLDLLVSTALVPVLGEDPSVWKPLQEKIDAGLQKLKDKKVTATEYGQKLLVIGEALL